MEKQPETATTPEKPAKPKHPWKARLVVGLIMLLLAFFGMTVTDIKTTGGWDYWKWMVFIYAILALWLSWYMKRQATKTLAPTTLGQEVLHWLGLICAIFLVSIFVEVGFISRLIAGVFDLTLISLAVFLAGIYIEYTFLVIGIILGICALLVVSILQYALIFPLFIGGAGLLILIAWLSARQLKSS